MLNDIYDVRDNPPRKIKKYLNYSFIFKLLNNVRRKIIYQNDYFDLQKIIESDYNKIKNINLIKNSFCEINSIFKKKDINIIFLYLPYMEGSDNWGNYKLHNIEKNILKYVKQCGFLNIISLTDSLIKFEYEDLILSQKFNHHFNKFANNLVAEKLDNFFLLNNN